MLCMCTVHGALNILVEMGTFKHAGAPPAAGLRVLYRAICSMLRSINAQSSTLRSLAKLNMACRRLADQWHLCRSFLIQLGCCLSVCQHQC